MLHNNTTLILGIDPGSNNVGFCLMYVNLPSGTIEHTVAWSVNLQKTDFYSFENALSIGDKVERINALHLYMLDILNQYNPCFLVSEQPFSNKKYPGTGLVLAEVFSAIKVAISRYNPCKQLHILPPKSAKKQMGDANADKHKMRLLVGSILGHINLSRDTGFERLDEHAIDAIAMAYTRYKSMF